jgi:hypothetical protein
LQTDRANFKLIPISSFDFYYLLNFNSSLVPLEIVAVQSFSLSSFSDYFLFFIFIFNFVLINFYYFFYLAPSFPANISIKRKVSAHSFQDPTVSKQIMQGASKTQKSKAKSRNSVVLPSSPQNAIV